MERVYVAQEYDLHNKEYTGRCEVYRAPSLAAACRACRDAHPGAYNGPLSTACYVAGRAYLMRRPDGPVALDGRLLSSVVDQ